LKKIVRNAVRKDLEKLIGQHHLIVRRGKDLVGIPITRIDLPRFIHGINSSGGVGQGPGEEGDVIGSDPDDGIGQAGDQPGEHLFEAELTTDELAEMLGEYLQLPHIVPKGRRNIAAEKDRYYGLRYVGPAGLRDDDKTFKKMLKRSMQTMSVDNLEEFDFLDPLERTMQIIPDDQRFRSWKTEQVFFASAVVYYMMDVSGSMTSVQKDIVRTMCFWIDTWLKKNFPGLEVHYIIHDAVAHEVDEETFYHTLESGGTKISSAYGLCDRLIELLPGGSVDWNIYAFHFSDGDNMDDDNGRCLSLLRDVLLQKCNQFSYVQVESQHGSGAFKKILEKSFGQHPKVISTVVRSRSGIVQAIKDLFVKGN
jgi:hypothetical protein